MKPSVDLPLAALNTGRLRRWAIPLGAALMLTGCHPYTLTLNDYPVYVPPELFADFEVKDTALRECVIQTIVDKHITAAEQLGRLVCTHGDIADVSGLEVFVGLTELSLAHNNLTRVTALLRLPALETVDLSANDKLDCGEARLLATNVGTIRLPPHCTQ